MRDRSPLFFHDLHRLDSYFFFIASVIIFLCFVVYLTIVFLLLFNFYQLLLLFCGIIYLFEIGRFMLVIFFFFILWTFCWFWGRLGKQNKLSQLV